MRQAVYNAASWVQSFSHTALMVLYAVLWYFLVEAMQHDNYAKAAAFGTLAILVRIEGIRR